MNRDQSTNLMPVAGGGDCVHAIRDRTKRIAALARFFDCLCRILNDTKRVDSGSSQHIKFQHGFRSADAGVICYSKRWLGNIKPVSRVLAPTIRVIKNALHNDAIYEKVSSKLTIVPDCEPSYPTSALTVPRNAAPCMILSAACNNFCSSAPVLQAKK